MAHAGALVASRTQAAGGREVEIGEPNLGEPHFNYWTEDRKEAGTRYKIFGLPRTCLLSYPYGMTRMYIEWRGWGG